MARATRPQNTPLLLGLTLSRMASVLMSVSSTWTWGSSDGADWAWFMADMAREPRGQVHLSRGAYCTSRRQDAWLFQLSSFRDQPPHVMCVVTKGSELSTA